MRVKGGLCRAHGVASDLLDACARGRSERKRRGKVLSSRRDDDDDPSRRFDARVRLPSRLGGR